MKAADIKSYLVKPETGAGLLFVALTFGIARFWAAYLFTAGESVAGALAAVLAAGSPQRLFFFWTLVSFAVGAWLAFLLLRRRLKPAMLRRVLLIATIHAVGAVRFYDWGLMLLSILPLFALVPAVLMPRARDSGQSD